MCFFPPQCLVMPAATAGSLPSCPTRPLCSPMDCSPPGSAVRGTLQQEYWSVWPFPSPGDLPDPGIKPVSLMSPALAAGSFTTSTTWEALAPVGSVVALRLGGDGLNQGGGAEGESSEQIARRGSRDRKARTTVLVADRLWWSDRGPDR